LVSTTLHFPVWKSIPHSYLLYLNVVMLYDNWYQQYQQELLCRPNGFMSLPHQTVNKIWSRCPMDIKMLSVGNYTQLCRARSFLYTALYQLNESIQHQTVSCPFFHLLPNLWTQYIGTNGSLAKDMKRSTLGVRRSTGSTVAGFGVEKERYHQVTDTTIPILWSVIRYRYWPWQHTECNIS